MARKKPAKAVPTGTVPESTHDDGKIEVRKIDTRRLLTIDVDHPIWDKGEKLIGVGGEPVKEAIVRLRAPVKATDIDVERVRRAYEEAGAAKVTVLPRLRTEVLPQDVQQSPAKAIGAREAVLCLVEESNTKDRDALRALCERVMGECGL